jgi:hypothetical protein
VTHCGCGGTGSSTTQQICPGLQQDTPQHVWLPVHAAPPSGSQGGVAQLPPMQVGVEAGQTCPQEPQLNGSSCVSRQRPPQQTLPFEHCIGHPASDPPLELPDPLLDPLEPLLEPLAPLLEPLLPPLDPPEPPPLLPLLPLLPSTEASLALPDVLVDPPQRTATKSSALPSATSHGLEGRTLSPGECTRTSGRPSSRPPVSGQCQ